MGAPPWIGAPGGGGPPWLCQGLCCELLAGRERCLLLCSEAARVWMSLLVMARWSHLKKKKQK